jgi:hypothetical protein
MGQYISYLYIFEKVYDSVRREMFYEYNILSEFNIPIKLVMLI